METTGWITKRVRKSTQDRIEKMISKDIGFDFAVNTILDDYDKLLSERIVQPDENLTLKNEDKIFVHIPKDKPKHREEAKEEDKPDKLTQYFLDHPERNIDNYTDMELKTLERDL